MTATQMLRKEVKKYIDKADDKSLRMVKAILEIEQEDNDEDDSAESEDWDELPRELQMMIDEAIKQGEEGDVISHEEMIKKYPQWFRK